MNDENETRCDNFIELTEYYREVISIARRIPDCEERRLLFELGSRLQRAIRQTPMITFS